MTEASAGEGAADLRLEAEQAIADGDLARGSYLCVRLGEIFEADGDSEGAESAFRQAVVLARQVDADDPELMLVAFVNLSDFLAPSDESVALAGELTANIIDRREMYHPMRAADAAYYQVNVMLQLAEIDPSRICEVLEVAKNAVKMCDDVCFHNMAQDIQRKVAATLNVLGCDAEASQWQAEADKYKDWAVFMNQEIPGHVHLWNIHPSGMG